MNRKRHPSWSVMVGSSARSEREPFLFAIRSGQTRFVASVIIANRKVLLSSTDRASRLHPSAGGRRHAPEPERLVSIRPIDVQLRPTGLLQVPEFSEVVPHAMPMSSIGGVTGLSVCSLHKEQGWDVLFHYCLLTYRILGMLVADVAATRATTGTRGMSSRICLRLRFQRNLDFRLMLRSPVYESMISPLSIG